MYKSNKSCGEDRELTPQHSLQLQGITLIELVKIYKLGFNHLLYSSGACVGGELAMGE